MYKIIPVSDILLLMFRGEAVAVTKYFYEACQVTATVLMSL